MLASEHTTKTGGRAFDSLAFAKRLETVGFTRQQAEALADEQVKLIDERLATKLDIEVVRADLEQLRIATKADIEVVRADLRESELRLQARIADKASDTVKWVVGIGFAQAAMIIGILKFHA